MNVLGLDSATDACSAAVIRDGALVAHRLEAMRRGHAESLMLLVQDVMARAKLEFDALDLIATTVGPGGFTGLRIGLASARALALAGRIPIVGVTTLEAVAMAHHPFEDPLLIALDSKRADIYTQLFGPGPEPLSTPRALLPKDIGAMLPPGPVAVAGSAADAVLGALDRRDPPPRRAKGPALPDAGVVAQIGEAKFTAAAPRDAAPSPLYLRAPDAKLPGERSP